MEGWIKIHRKMKAWGWYKNENTKSVFLHLLLEANHQVKEFMGHKILPGQVVVGRNSLSKDTGLSIQRVRTSLAHLASTNEITIKTTNKFSIITITKWDIYQGANQDINHQLTINQPSTNHQLTTNKNEKNEKNEKNIRGSGFNKPLTRVELLYNKHLGRMLSQVKRSSDERRRQIKVLSQTLNTEQKWIEYFSKVAESEFLCGKNDRGWRADFDWLLKGDNYLKVIEGRYGDHKNENKYDF